MKCRTCYQLFPKTFICSEDGPHFPTSATGLGLSQRAADWTSPLRGCVSSGRHAQSHAGPRATAEGVLAVRRQWVAAPGSRRRFINTSGSQLVGHDPKVGTKVILIGLRLRCGVLFEDFEYRYIYGDNVYHLFWRTHFSLQFKSFKLFIF